MKGPGTPSSTPPPTALAGPVQGRTLPVSRLIANRCHSFVNQVRLPASHCERSHAELHCSIPSTDRMNRPCSWNMNFNINCNTATKKKKVENTVQQCVCPESSPDVFWRGADLAGVHPVEHKGRPESAVGFRQRVIAVRLHNERARPLVNHK